MGMFDCVNADVVCHSCLQVVNVYAQTKLRPNPNGEEIGIGDFLPIPIEDMRNEGYFTVSLPAIGEPIRLMMFHFDGCRKCEYKLIFPQITILNDHIQKVDLLLLTPQSLDQLHFVETYFVQLIEYAMEFNDFYDLLNGEIFNAQYKELLKSKFAEFFREDRVRDGKYPIEKLPFVILLKMPSHEVIPLLRESIRILRLKGIH